MKKIDKSVPHATNLRAIAKYNSINRGDKVAFKYIGKDKEIVDVTYSDYESLYCGAVLSYVFTSVSSGKVTNSIQGILFNMDR